MAIMYSSAIEQVERELDLVSEKIDALIDDSAPISKREQKHLSSLIEKMRNIVERYDNAVDENIIDSDGVIQINDVETETDSEDIIEQIRQLVTQ